jgi:hypothetical protein
MRSGALLGRCAVLTRVRLLQPCQRECRFSSRSRPVGRLRRIAVCTERISGLTPSPLWPTWCFNNTGLVRCRHARGAQATASLRPNQRKPKTF